MKRYSKYRQSGIEWIGDIPEHWEAVKLKYSISTLESGSRESGGGNLIDGVFSIGGEHIGWLGELLLNNPKYITVEYFANLKNGIVKQDDVLLVKDGATIGKCAIIKSVPFEKCAVNEHVFILRANKNFNPEFIFRFIWCSIGREQILLNVRGSAQPGLNSYFVNEVFITKPPLNEQDIISNYLNGKISPIDKLISSKQKLIELLKEERTAIINEAVSGKGKKWERKKLKYICSLLKDGTHLPPPRVENGVPLLSVRNLVDRSYIQFLDDDSNISEEDFIMLEKVFSIKENDILLAIVGATMGKVSLVPAMTRFTIQRSVGIFRPKIEMMFFKFLFFYFQSSFFQNLIWNNTGFSAQPGIYLSSLLNFSSPCPLIKEQIEIVNYLETETQRIDNAVFKIEKEIELLQEYKTALISEVVTGKIKVI